MAETFSLRCYCYLDRMQPQFAAFVGTITQGDLPTEGMAALYVEMAPGNEVFRVVDIAVKATEARPGAQIVEREFGMFEVHSRSQADVRERMRNPGKDGTRRPDPNSCARASREPSRWDGCSPRSTCTRMIATSCSVRMVTWI